MDCLYSQLVQNLTVLRYSICWPSKCFLHRLNDHTSKLDRQSHVNFPLQTKRLPQGSNSEKEE